MVVINSRDINRDMSLGIANSMLAALNGLPVEHSLSCLNGIVVAMTRFIMEIKKNAEVSDEDGIEKLILSWLSGTDIFTGLKFSRYISTDCIDIDFDNL